MVFQDDPGLLAFESHTCDELYTVSNYESSSKIHHDTCAYALGFQSCWSWSLCKRGCKMGDPRSGSNLHTHYLRDS